MFKKIIFFTVLITVTGLTTLVFISQASRSEALIIDHRHTNISQIPTNFIQQAQNSFSIFYGHTSHGSQIVTGMDNLDQGANGLYHYNDTGANGGLKLVEYSSDLGQNGDTSWADVTRNYFNQAGADYNIVIWSWCGGVSDNTTAGINTYLNTMNQLETEYPNVTFIYMTGHLDGTGESGTLHQMNNLIRTYAQNNNKVLFDFADIESYDPDGNYFLNRGADDGCNYSGGNWASQWCSANPTSELCTDCSCDCAHSQILNCNLKGRAFWYLLARLAGWGTTDTNTNSQVNNNTNTQTNTNINTNQNTNTSLDIYQQTVAREQNRYRYTNRTLTNRVAGKILLQVEENGEAWYVYPNDQKKYFLGRPYDAFNIMRRLGLGATHQFITSYIIYPDRVAGKILLDVEQHGEAYYIYPGNKKAYYLSRPADAFRIMRELGLGISNENIRYINVGEIN